MTKHPTESISISACSLVRPQVRPSVHTHSIGSSIMSFIKPRKTAHANFVIPILMMAAEYGCIMSISHFDSPCMFFYWSFGFTFSQIPWLVNLLAHSYSWYSPCDLYFLYHFNKWKSYGKVERNKARKNERMNKRKKERKIERKKRKEKKERKWKKEKWR